MARSGKKLNLEASKFGSRSLVTIDQEREIRRRKTISFSFSFFRQIKHFGIGDCSQAWHAGLLERLAALSDMSLQDMLEENRGSSALRCHLIDWSAKHIPIRREELDWLPVEIQENDVEFPMMQISISQGTGRMIGYFDREYSIFHVVLLDPKHNMQPSRKTNYQVRPTHEGVSQYDELLKRLNRMKEFLKRNPNTNKLHELIAEMDRLHENIVYINLDNDFYEKYGELLDSYSLREIVETGIMQLS